MLELLFSLSAEIENAFLLITNCNPLTPNEGEPSLTHTLLLSMHPNDSL
jgi:hypothetical protein